jgi:HTH-type transcriptional regulator/antitoxin HipB
MGYPLQIPSQLSSHLRALRKAKGLSQAALGKRLGLSQARIARIEGDPLSIRVDQLLEVLTALGVRVTLDPLSTTPPTARGTAAITPPAMLATGSATVGKVPLPRATTEEEEDW